MAAYAANEVSTVWQRALVGQQPRATEKISDLFFDDAELLTRERSLCPECVPKKP